jgi:hypothetical protein
MGNYERNWDKIEKSCEVEEVN